ncbi:MAG: hypothetical protein HZB16_15285, partial [Armatimonadetes bacterium]|nr:hypothetical protein [Armatimonadota bacterium]
MTSRWLFLVIAMFGSLSAEPLWTVGRPDRSTAEFALTPGRYADWRGDALMEPGAGDPARDWPCLQPGPGDAWAGSRPHTYALVFGLKSAGADVGGRLTIDLLDAQKPYGSRLRIAVNGHATERDIPAGGGDQVLSGDLSAVRPTQLALDLPAGWLRAGTNQVEITTLSGCWVLYDALRLEAAGWTRQPVPTAAVFSARADNVLSRRDGELRQVVNAQVRLLGKATEGTFSVGGKPLATVALKPGTQDIDLALPEVNQPTPVTLRLTVAGTEPNEQSVELRPVRHLTIYLLPHSHVDIGYTAR